MKNRKRGLFAGIIAIVLSVSCCWISALAIWIGSGTVLGMMALYLESLQIPLLLLGVLLVSIAMYSYFKKKRTNRIL